MRVKYQGGLRSNLRARFNTQTGIFTQFSIILGKFFGLGIKMGSEVGSDDNN